MYVVSLQQVVGPSMKPTLNNGEILLLNKFIYHFKEPKEMILLLSHMKIQNI
jgi:signal peptidase I